MLFLSRQVFDRIGNVLFIHVAFEVVFEPQTLGTSNSATLLCELACLWRGWVLSISFTLSGRAARQVWLDHERVHLSVRHETSSVGWICKRVVHGPLLREKLLFLLLPDFFKTSILLELLSRNLVPRLDLADSLLILDKQLV